MSPTLDAFLRSWPFDPWLILALTVSAGVYLRGWFVLQRRDPRRWRARQPVAFFGGLAALFLALGSPIEPFSGLLLQVHMLQHMLLMMVAPPLLWLGAPYLPMLRGLPGPIRTVWVAPVVGRPLLRRVAATVTQPFLALPLFVATTWAWHIPAIYAVALRSSGWHYVQHVCFFTAALLFWYPVVLPFPSRPAWSSWLLVPYLIVADLQNTVLAALLTFSDKVLYAHYNDVPRIAGLSALDDQAAAGVIMWVPGSVAFLLPLFCISIRLLHGTKGLKKGRRRRIVDGHGWAQTPTSRGELLPILSQPSGRAACHPPDKPALDLLRMPVVGRFLRWRHARTSLQLPLLLLAGVVIFDGLWGPQVAPMNLAGVLPWIHWRGIVIVGLLVAGNVFCLSCPFMLPRTLARRWLSPRWSWPRWLRNKWLAVLLVGLFLWAYEALALWDSPSRTACIVVGYFVGAFVIDGLFRQASFCKYVCPIGQFNFVQSLVSPLEVGVRQPAVCTSCRTKDCIRGRDGIPGCELNLFVPRKAGNLDCTMCLDCIHACPHDNVGIFAGLPAGDLGTDKPRSSIGRYSQRPDLAALVAVLVFGAFANAAGMVAPVLEWQRRLQMQIGLRSSFLLTCIFYLVTLVVLPLLAMGGAAVLGRRWARSRATMTEVATSFAFALVPLGFGMWLAHYSFHFLTSCDAAIPAAQRFAGQLGWTTWGTPVWLATCCRQSAAWIPRLEIVFLQLGLLLSLYTGYRITLSCAPRPPQALKLFAPWALLIGVMFVAGVWILLQPMQMRGTLLGVN